LFLDENTGSETALPCVGEFFSRLVRLAPRVLKVASADQLGKINEAPHEEVEARNRAEETLRRHVEAKLLASEDKLRSCFEAASQGILGVASNGRISLVNRRTEQMFGYSREELLGQKLEMLLPERFRDGHVAHRDSYCGASVHWGAEMELAARRKDGSEFPIEIGLSYVNTPDCPLAFGMVSYISARIKDADELKRVNEELRRSNVEIEQFAHVASHDLQEPLRMVTNYLQLIERRYNTLLDDDGREFLHFAMDGAKRMRALIKDLLDFSRAGSNVSKVSMIPPVAPAALSNLKTAIDESGANSQPIRCRPSPRSCSGYQVFAPIANAIKFKEARRPQCTFADQAGEWIFSIRDNGIGIEARHLDRIFESLNVSIPLEILRPRIGLSITRKIVRQAEVWVESQPGTDRLLFLNRYQAALTNGRNMADL
jgi:PAS domain S-box-containing protein